MDVKRRIPHEGVKKDDGLDGYMRLDDQSDDTEGHLRVTPEDLTVNPGTGGDFTPRHPSTGGEFIDENDVEGH